MCLESQRKLVAEPGLDLKTSGSRFTTSPRHPGLTTWILFCSQGRRGGRRHCSCSRQLAFCLVNCDSPGLSEPPRHQKALSPPPPPFSADIVLHVLSPRPKAQRNSGRYDVGVAVLYQTGRCVSGVERSPGKLPYPASIFPAGIGAQPWISAFLVGTLVPFLTHTRLSSFVTLLCI